ncbi:MAG: response regulator [Pseudomonadota bacterium]
MKRIQSRNLLFKKILVCFIVIFFTYSILLFLIQSYFYGIFSSDLSIIEKRESDRIAKINFEAAAHNLANILKERLHHAKINTRLLSSAFVDIITNNANISRNQLDKFRSSFTFHENGMSFTSPLEDQSFVFTGKKVKWSSFSTKLVYLSKDLEGMMKEIIQSDNFYHLTYLNFEGNIIRMYPKADMKMVIEKGLINPDFELNELPFYKQANQDRNPERRFLWSSIYKAEMSDFILISTMQPIYVQDVFIGVLSIDIRIDKFIEELSQMAKKINSEIAIIDNNQDIYAENGDLTRNFGVPKGKISKINIENLEKHNIRVELEKFSNGSISFSHLSHYKMYAASSLISDFNMYLLLLTKEETISSMGHRIIKTSLGYIKSISIRQIIALILLFSGISCTLYILIRKYLLPVKKIGDAIQMVALGNFNIDLDIHTGDDFQYLANGLERMSNELNAYQSQIKKNTRLVAIGQTTSMLAHDIRKPFTSMKSMLAMMENYKNNPSFLSHAKNTVNQTINHVESMISDILDFSREVKLETSPESISALLDFSIRQEAQAYKDISLEFNYKLENKFQALMDDKRMARVFSNVIGNGIEALASHQATSSPPQAKNSLPKKEYSYTIWFKTCDKKIDGHKFIEIIIGNNGPAFKEDDIPNLFESFFTKGNKRGTGLGLASANKIVNLHGGKIEARNCVQRTEYSVRREGLKPPNSPVDDGKTGVEFVITIPASEVEDKHNISILPKSTDEILFVKYEPDQDKLDEKLELLSQHEKIKIVLLEDETLYRAFVRNIIKNSEILNRLITLYDADNVDEAIELIKKENISYAIVDIDLNEDKDGYDFLRLTRDDKMNVTSLIHSNRYLDHEIQKAYDLGAKSYASKPLSIEQLVDFLHKSLSMEDSTKGQYPAINIQNDSPLICFIADDNMIIREAFASILKDILRDYEHKIYKFEHPQDLLDKAEKIKPDIVISDNIFGVNDNMLGEELLAILKDKNPSALLYLSSDTDKDLLKAKAERLNITGYFPPNIDKATLSELLLKELRNIKKSNKIDESKNKEALGKYCHDLNKPIMNAYVMLNSATSIIENMEKDNINWFVETQVKNMKKLLEDKQVQLEEFRNYIIENKIEENKDVILEIEDEYSFIDKILSNDYSKYFLKENERNGAVEKLGCYIQKNKKLFKSINI